jgi:O-antigen/teichoic acid export membrane protein
VTEGSETGTPPVTTRRILGRFGHLLSAQGVEGITSAGFFLYLAWLNSAAYGQVMYAMAAGAMVMKVVQFGLYIPVVADLTKLPAEETPGLLNQANLIKLILLIPSMAVVAGLALARGFSDSMTAILLLICLGHGLVALAETFFADYRVRGRQSGEARIKMAASLGSYGFGFVLAWLGGPSVLVACFKLVAGLIQLIPAAKPYLTRSAAVLRTSLERGPVWRLFKAASVFAMFQIIGTLYNKTNIFFLESAAGTKSVAMYSATWNIVDPISVLASEQLLGWVIFPLLAMYWFQDRERAGRLVRTNALWLMLVALPLMFVLFVESNLIIDLIYPDEFKPAASLQRYLVWTIFISFESNLFAYVMMVAGAARTLLIFSIVTMILNLLLNLALVGPFELTGGCLVIVLTKLIMLVMTFTYCQKAYRFFFWHDLVFPLLSAAMGLALFIVLDGIVVREAATVCALALYGLVVWKAGPRFVGRMAS